MSFEQFMAAMGGGGMGRNALLEETRERLKEYDPGSKKLMKVAKKVLSNMERIPFQVGDLVEQESFSDYNFPVEGCPAVVLKTGKPGEFGVGEPGKAYRAEDMVVAILDLDGDIITHSVESYRFKKVGSI
jgi:hypothetical protein